MKGVFRRRFHQMRSDDRAKNSRREPDDTDSEPMALLRGSLRRSAVHSDGSRLSTVIREPNSRRSLTSRLANKPTALVMALAVLLIGFAIFGQAWKGLAGLPKPATKGDLASGPRVSKTVNDRKLPRPATVGTTMVPDQIAIGRSSVGSAIDPSGPAVPKVVGQELVNAATGYPLRLVGVDTTGTEDACVQDRGFAWGSSDATEAAAIASWHANAVRVPLNEDCWLSINGAPTSYSGVAYQTKIKKWVSALNRAGIVAILDLHWSAPGSYEALQQWPMADADHSITFWSQVAKGFSETPSVIFDLFNEPFLGESHPSASDWSCWRNGGCTITFTPRGSTTVVSYLAAGMQQLLSAVRSAGANQPVMVGGLNWAGDPCGIGDPGGDRSTCTWLSYTPFDPEHQMIASFHTYDWTACATPTCWGASVIPVAKEVPVVTGELGERDCSANYVDQYMTWADQNNISYLLWAWQPASKAASCGASNLDLLSSWRGTPNIHGPAGAAIDTHLSTFGAP